jgi:phage-related protein
VEVIAHMDDDRHLVPQAEEELRDLKQEVAEDLGVPLREGGDNGDLTARELGKVGGNMVRRLVQRGEEALRRDREGDH